MDGARMAKAVLASMVVLCACLAAGVARGAAPADLPPLPPLTDPATGEHLPGKFVWADFFTSDIEGARTFYGELFGWEWRWVSTQLGHLYGIFYADGVPVAGVAERPGPDPDKPYGRWIYYISVDDVERSVADVEAAGGRTLIKRPDFPERGSFAVVADADGALFGVMNSTSGDPADFRAEPGEWLWINLYTRNAVEASQHYASLFGFNTYAPDEESEVVDIVLAKNEYARAGVGQLSENSQSHPTWLGYVRVEDVDAAAASARALGGDAVYGPDESIVGGDLAIVRDPLGAPVGILQWTFAEDEADAAEDMQ
jgi:predicted enzyme related to lactoylglutathione lyase